MKSECLTRALVFDLSKLLPGRVVHLISSPNMPGESPRRTTALIKDVNRFSITLIIVRLDVCDKESMTGKVKEETYPVSAFEGTGCYGIELLNIENREENPLNF